MRAPLPPDSTGSANAPRASQPCAGPSPNNARVASTFLDVLSQLHDHHVDFVIVGGVAAALHGGTRVTFDLDVVPRLAAPSWQAAIDVLWSLGARPRIPEALDRIRDVEQIRRWQRDKGMLALN